MTDVVIVAATRTAIGSFGGSLAGLSAVDLGAAVISSIIDKTGIDAGIVDEVLMGQVLTAAAGQNPARQSAIKQGSSSVCHDHQQSLRLGPEGRSPCRAGYCLW